jgi:hypothetical protein
MIPTGQRAVPPVSWEHASLSQIRDSLHPEESEEDIYRIVGQIDEWIEVLTSHLEEHERHWTAVAGSAAGEAHAAAAAHGARTRADLAAALDDLRTVRASLDSLAAMFVNVRGRVERLYQDALTRQPMLDWVLARDDEPAEMTRRDSVQLARWLMRQYEETTNQELKLWPAAGTRPASGSSVTTASVSTTVPLRDGQAFPGDDGPTKPTRTTDRQHPTSTSAAGGAFPGGTFNTNDGDVVRRNPFETGEELFDTNGDAFPPVIENSTFDEDEEGGTW